jgi:hypothetical protein
MKRLAATAITLMMTAAIGAAAASSFDHNNRPQESDDSVRTSSHAPQKAAYNAQNSRYAYNRGPGSAGTYTNTNVRYSSNVARGRWDGHDHDGDGRWNRYQYRPRGYYGYYGYGGYRARYYPTVSIAYYGGPAYYPASYYAAPYAYDNVAYAYDNGYAGDNGQYAYANGPYAYGNGYACDPRVRYDNNGGKIVGALIGGVLGNTVGKGDGRTAATVAGAAIGYGVGASVDNDRRYGDCGSY